VIAAAMALSACGEEDRTATTTQLGIDHILSHQGSNVGFELACDPDPSRRTSTTSRAQGRRPHPSA
jgi:hypothetical protein